MRSRIVLESNHLVMLLYFLTFALSVRCIRSSESSPRSQPFYLSESQLLLRPEIMNQFLASQQQGNFESPTSKKMATAETTLDGYVFSVTYSGKNCQGNIEQTIVVSLNFCYNFTFPTTRNIYNSYKYSYASPTSNATMVLYKDDKCETLFNSFTTGFRGCYFGGRQYISYSSTMSLPKLPTDPIARYS
jgi:hypothetical protein